ncbi:MAG: hypothetical protein IPK60_18420 [Sandaracinaceae bacterium]|nr:hypothetical protein [Sandaracinaceae bacterium]
MTRTFALLATSTLVLLCGCEQSARVGSTGDAGANDGGTNLPEDSACQCIDPDMPCCADELFCYAPTPCNVVTADGCYNEGRCLPKLSYGEPCQSARQCADEDARCDSISGCQPPPLGEERCEVDLDCSSGRQCAASYCLLRAGETCSANSECASNRCYGSTHYTCL